MSRRGQQRLLNHDKSRLTDLMMAVLPRSFNKAWDHTRPVEVFFTSGYGHPLPWVLHEFEPRRIEWVDGTISVVVDKLHVAATDCLP
jgi:hypothetical protein